MLPRPARKRWLSSNGLMRPRRRASISPSRAAVKSSANGSGPNPPNTPAGSSIRCNRPNLRVSEKRRHRPSSRENSTRTCRASGKPPGPSTSCPVMRRCASNVSPPLSVITTHFPRRPTPVTVWPVRRRAKTVGLDGMMLRAQRTSTPVMVCPTRDARSPRATVSTSGNSGMAWPL